MTDKRKLLRYFAYTIEIITIYLLNETSGLIPPISGTRPVLLLPVAVSIAVSESGAATIGFGLSRGVLLDFDMSGGAALGFHTLLLSVLCSRIGLMAVHLLRASLLTDSLLSTAVVGLILLLQWLFYYMLSGCEYPGFVLVNRFLPRFVHTLLPVSLIYAFNQTLMLNIREGAN